MRVGQPRLMLRVEKRAKECLASTTDAQILQNILVARLVHGNISRMRRQCIPGPLPSFGGGPGYEANRTLARKLSTPPLSKRQRNIDIKQPISFAYQTRPPLPTTPLIVLSADAPAHLICLGLDALHTP